MTKSDGGRGGLPKKTPKVMGEGEGVGLFSMPKVTSFINSPKRTQTFNKSWPSPKTLHVSQYIFFGLEEVLNVVENVPILAILSKLLWAEVFSIYNVNYMGGGSKNIEY